jgi:calcium-dependent protein kinase
VTKKSGNIKDYYRIGPILAEARFGDVHLITQRDSGIQRCTKVYRKEKMSFEDRDEFKREINLLKELDHPNILKLIEFFEDQKRYFVIYDYIKGGDLFDYVLNNQALKEEKAA